MKTKSKLDKVPKQSLAIFAYETIVRRIICLEYKPNQHLEETHLMADLGIGRTPIREALARLQGERMVESHPNRGVIVKPITLQTTKAMFESMNIFEFGVADIAMTKNCNLRIERMRADNASIEKAIQAKDLMEMVEANHRFHMHFAMASQNEFFIRAIQDVRNEAKRLSFLSYNTILEPKQNLENHYALVIKEHDKIISCLESKAIIPLKEILTIHIETFRNRIIQFMVS